MSGYVQLRLASPAKKYVESGWGTWSDEECRVRMYMWAVDLYCWAGMLLSFWLTFDNYPYWSMVLYLGYLDLSLLAVGWFLGCCKDVVAMAILDFYSVVRVYPQWGKLLTVSCVKWNACYECVLWFDRLGLNVPLILSFCWNQRTSDECLVSRSFWYCNSSIGRLSYLGLW